MRRGAAELSRLDTLTATQRRVLELMAQGRTNYEIGQALGITLDGAKYHVSEVLNKLGVNSREEAVSVLERRFSVPLPSFRPLPRVLKRVFVPVAALSAAAAAAMFLRSAFDHDEPPPPAFRAVFQQEIDEAGHGKRILLLDGTGNVRQIGPDGDYTMTYWSPDGRNLFVTGNDEGTYRQALHIFDVKDGSHITWTSLEYWFPLGWSPDSQHFALIGHESMEIRDSDGARVAELPLPQRTLRSGLGGSGNGWTGDSKRVAGTEGRLLMTLAVDGSGGILELPDGFVGEHVFVEGWHGASTLRIASAPFSRAGMPAPRAWERDMDAGGSWEEISWSPLVSTGPGREEEAQQLADVAGPATPMSCPTADGGGIAHVIVAGDLAAESRRASADGRIYRPPILALVIEHEERLFKVPLPAGIEITSLYCSSVVLMY